MLLKSAGIRAEMRPDEGLAPMTGLGLPWRRANYLKSAMELTLAHLQTGSLNSGSEFDMYSKTIQEVEKMREELEYAEQERDTLQQVVTY
eukprot:Em0002g1477a